jgi:hypothetical protein
MFPFPGKQPRNIFQRREDIDSIHWWFLEVELLDELPLEGKIKEIIMMNPVTFNCFLRGTEKTSGESPVLKGTFEIEEFNAGIMSKLREKYPNVRVPSGSDAILTYANLEKRDQISSALKTGKRIFKAIAKTNPEYLTDRSDESCDVSSESGSAEVRRFTRRKSFMNLKTVDLSKERRKIKKQKKEKKKFKISPVRKKKRKDAQI